MRSRRWIRHVITATALALLSAACSDGSPVTQPGSPSVELPPDLVVSDPVLHSPPTSASQQGGAEHPSLASAGVGHVVYVSLPGGSLLAATSVTIRNRTTGGAPSGPISLVNGGFDPVPVAASAGDELELSMTDATGAIIVYRASVPKRRPPRVVRTSPPKGATDVPVNAHVVVVFTEPVAPATATTATVQLLHGTSSVPGTLRPVNGSLFAVEFVPDAELERETTYRLLVTKGILDEDGDALETEVAIEFTTMTNGSGLHHSSIVAGFAHTCALRADGSVRCWGGNTSGQLGAGNDLLGIGTCPSTVPGSVLLCSTVPVTVGGGHAFASLASGFEHTCALTTAGDAFCWGTSDDGHGGEVWPPSCDPTTGACACIATDGKCNGAPLQVGGTLEFGSLVAGYYHSCGIRIGGSAYCWGDELLVGALGTGAALSVVPAAVVGGIAFTSLVSGAHHMCGLDASGTAYCWGLNLRGQLGFSGGADCSGLPSTGSYVWWCVRAPVRVGGGLTFVTLTAGWQHTCGLTQNGRAYCWGDLVLAGSFGTAPSLVDPDLAFISLGRGAAASHICGVTAANVGYCWGENGFGQLGDGTTVSSHVPVRVAGGLALAAIAVGAEHSCGITTTGEFHCWGGNRAGQLGAGYASSGSLTPIRVQGQ